VFVVQAVFVKRTGCLRAPAGEDGAATKEANLVFPFEVSDIPADRHMGNAETSGQLLYRS